MGQSPKLMMKQEEVVVQMEKRRAEGGIDTNLNGHGRGKGRDKDPSVLNDDRNEESTGRNAHYSSAPQEEQAHEVLVVDNDDQEDEAGFHNGEQFEDVYDETEGEFDEDDEGDDEEDDEEGDGEEDYEEETYDEDDDGRDEEGMHVGEHLAPPFTGFAALNGQRQVFGNGQFGNMQGPVNGSNKAGTSAEDAIEL